MATACRNDFQGNRVDLAPLVSLSGESVVDLSQGDMYASNGGAYLSYLPEGREFSFEAMGFSASSHPYSAYEPI